MKMGKIKKNIGKYDKYIQPDTTNLQILHYVRNILNTLHLESKNIIYNIHIDLETKKYNQ